MRYLLWIFRAVLLVVVILFALKNMAPVNIDFWGYYELQALPLVVVILVSLLLGAFWLYLATLPYAWRRRQAQRQLQQECRQLQQQVQQLRQRAPIAPHAPTTST